MTQAVNLAASLSVALPEVVIAIGTMVLLMLGVFRTDKRDGGMVLWLAVALLAVAALLVATGTKGAAFGGMFIADGFARFAKLLILAGVALTLVLSIDYLRKAALMQFEFPVLVLLATLGMLLMVSANDLIALYMGIELQSLALYVLAAFRRDSARSTEAGLKYFVLGALSSGILLYGASLTYGWVGSTRFEAIAAAIQGPDLPLGMVIGLVFLVAGLAFKLSAAPFHMWTPDVYEGSPTPVTALFAGAPKVAAAALFARVMVSGFGDASAAWSQVVALVAALSMLVGALAAIGQTNLKRLLAYSSIGHMGFALMGLAAGTLEGTEGLLTYLAIYLVMSLGIFAFVLTMRREGRPVTAISDLSGLGQAQPAAALALAVLLFSLAGVPPLAGFFAKFFVFVAAVDAGMVWLAVVGAVASAISAFYYIRLVKMMYFDPAEKPLDAPNAPLMHGLTLAVSALIMAVAWLPFLDGFGLIEGAAKAAATLAR